jgi:glucose-6-phosphate dehydrogenase assembly protein OpcA
MIVSDWWSARSVKMTVQDTMAKIAALEIVATLASQDEGKDILEEFSDDDDFGQRRRCYNKPP